MRKKIAAVGAVTGGILIALLWIFAPQGSAKTNELVIGANLELSGALAPYGRAALDGIQMAVEELNEAGGVAITGGTVLSVRLCIADNRSVGADSAGAVQYLLHQRHADVIIGPSTSTTVKAAISADARALLIAPSATADALTAHTGATKLIRLCFTDRQQGTAMAAYADQMGFRKAILLTDMASDYSKGTSRAFAAAFKLLGGEIQHEEFFLSGDTDFLVMLTRLKQLDFDCIYLPAYYTEAGLIIRQARELGINAAFLSGDAMDSPSLADIIGKSEYQRNIYYTSHFSPDSERYQAFSEAFYQRYGQYPSAYAALAYDCVMFYAAAVSAAGTDAFSEVSQMIHAMHYTGVTGEIRLTEQGDCQKTPVLIDFSAAEASRKE